MSYQASVVYPGNATYPTSTAPTGAQLFEFYSTGQVNILVGSPFFNPLLDSRTLTYNTNTLKGLTLAITEILSSSSAGSLDITSSGLTALNISTLNHVASTCSLHVSASTLTTMSLASLVLVETGIVGVSGALLTNITAPNSILMVDSGTQITLTGALTAACENLWLDALIAGGGTEGVFDISGGTNAAPDAGKVTTVEAQGITVIHN